MIMLLTWLFVLFVCCLSVNHKTEAATTVTATTTGLYYIDVCFLVSVTLRY